MPACPRWQLIIYTHDDGISISLMDKYDPKQIFTNKISADGKNMQSNEGYKIGGIVEGGHSIWIRHNGYEWIKAIDIYNLDINNSTEIDFQDLTGYPPIIANSRNFAAFMHDNDGVYLQLVSFNTGESKKEYIMLDTTILKSGIGISKNHIYYFENNNLKKLNLTDFMVQNEEIEIGGNLHNKGIISANDSGSMLLVWDEGFKVYDIE